MEILSFIYELCIALAFLFLGLWVIYAVKFISILDEKIQKLEKDLYSLTLILHDKVQKFEKHLDSLEREDIDNE